MGALINSILTEHKRADLYKVRMQKTASDAETLIS
jgi:hypothetical protein